MAASKQSSAAFASWPVLSCFWILQKDLCLAIQFRFIVHRASYLKHHSSWNFNSSDHHSCVFPSPYWTSCWLCCCCTISMAFLRAVGPRYGSCCCSCSLHCCCGIDAIKKTTLLLRSQLYLHDNHFIINFCLSCPLYQMAREGFDASLYSNFAIACWLQAANHTQYSRSLEKDCSSKEVKIHLHR